MFSRLVPATRVGVRSAVGASAKRTLATGARSHQRSHQQSASSSASGAFRWAAAGVAAILSGSVAIVACEVVEQAKGGDVDYAALRKDLENLIDSAEGSDTHGHKTRAEMDEGSQWVGNQAHTWADEADIGQWQSVNLSQKSGGTESSEAAAQIRWLTPCVLGCFSLPLSLQLR